MNKYWNTGCFMILGEGAEARHTDWKGHKTWSTGPNAMITNIFLWCHYLDNVKWRNVKNMKTCQNTKTCGKTTASGLTKQAKHSERWVLQKNVSDSSLGQQMFGRQWNIMFANTVPRIQFRMTSQEKN